MKNSNYILTQHGDIVNMDQLQDNVKSIIQKYSMEHICQVLLESKILINESRIKNGYPFEKKELIDLIDCLYLSFSLPVL
jgi:hypothetical protein